MRYLIYPNRSGALVGLIVAVGLVAGACGGNDEATTTTAPQTAATTTTVATAPTTTTAPATTAPATTTTTTVATTTTTVATTTTTTTVATTTTVDVYTLASGSGCTPGAGALPDGTWFGLVATTSDAELEFDLACWFTGDAAVLASAEDGEESPPPNDYYVRNGNNQLRTIAVAAAADVLWYPNVGDPSSEATVTYTDWLVGRDLRGVGLQPAIWINTEGGAVVSIEEQWVP